MYNYNNKIVPLGTKVHWIGYGNYEISHLLQICNAEKIFSSLHFRFDEMHSSMPSYSPPPSYHNIIPKLKVGETEEFDLSTVSGEFYIKHVRFFYIIYT